MSHSTGILSYGIYLPGTAIRKKTITRAWGGGEPEGIRRIANHDEDTATLAVEAVQRCLRGHTGERIGGLYLCSTSFPYQEKQTSPFVAMVNELDEGIRTMDIGNSRRSATTGLIAARDSVERGGHEAVVVVSAETRRCAPGSELETEMSDGACALAVGRGDTIADILEAESYCEEYVDIWRNGGERFVRSSGDKLYVRTLLISTLEKGIRAFLGAHPGIADELEWVVLPTSDQRIAQTVARDLGLRPQMFAAAGTGDTGSAQPLLGLAGVLESAKPGDGILVAGCGQGTDVLYLKMRRKPAGGADYLRRETSQQPRHIIENYNQYLRMLNVYEANGSDPEPLGSIILSNRMTGTNYRFHGQRCDSCGAVQYPPRRVCWKCRARDNFSDLPLSRRGTIYTYTVGYIYPSVDIITPMAVIDLDGGGRVLLQLTDCSAEEIRIGARVELVMRVLHHAGDFSNYYWKARLVADAESEEVKHGIG